MKNYRPVSNIRFLGKVIEKVVSSQLKSYINANGLAEPLQSAYRACHGTETALLCVQNSILQAIDQQRAVFLILLDLSAAFDTLDHNIMLSRFQKQFGITGTALQWFQSYFTQRKNHVHINGANSDVVPLVWGVPQGSVIGPQSFPMYVQPVCDILREHNVDYHMYADDIQIMLTCDPMIPGDAECAIFKLSKCVKDVEKWMLANKLKLNQNKTEFLIAVSRRHHHLLANICLPLDNTTIQPSKTVRNLGVIFDKYMTMDDHVTSVCKTVNYHLRNLGRIRKFVDSDTCHTAVRALITSRLDYCNSLLNGVSAKTSNRLQLLQNRAARLIYMKPKRTHTSPLLSDLHWLRITQRIQFKTLVLTYKALHNESPQYLSDLLHIRSHRYNIRASLRTTLHIPRTNKSAGDRSFAATAPRLWNSLPDHIPAAVTTGQFKRLLKYHLFN